METINRFGMYFNMLKIKFQDYNQSLQKNNVEIPNDKANVFVNIETGLNYLSTVRDLENKLIMYKRYPDELKTDIINVAAHYKDFFTSNGVDTKIFLYMTDLSSEIYEFNESKLIEDYRSYYLMKYTSNPKFIELGERLKEEIIPDIKLLCQYIPNVYFLSSKNVDSRLIPYVVGTTMEDRTNFIISGDISESLYKNEKNFYYHYHKRSIHRGTILCSTTEELLKEITKIDKISPEMVKLYDSGIIYNALIASIGDKYRSISQIQGLSVSSICKYVVEAIKEKKLTMDVNNPMLFSSVFPENLRGELYTNLLATNIKNGYESLSDGVKKELLSQIKDQSDINTLKDLNRTRFKENPLILEELLK